MKIAIHQPNFVPWMPYFEKIAAADVFVFLTHCQYEKNGYQNRFQLGGRWYTMGVRRGMNPIIDKEYYDYERDWSKILQQTDGLEPYTRLVDKHLAGTNIRLIRAIARDLGITTPTHIDFETARTGTDRLIQICQHHDCDEYISGPSGPKYMDMAAFDRAGIKVTVHEAKHKIPILEELCG